MASYYKKALVWSKHAASKVRKHFSSFHALQSSLRMDKIDYTFKFSTELLVAGLTLAIAAVNLFGVSALQNMGNTNLLAKIMSSNPNGKNQALYAESQTSVVNVVEQSSSNNPIFATAAAADIPAQLADSQPTSIGDNAIISDNTIDNPNPDTVKNLIADQIKVYVTQPGDTLSSIAAANNISINTIKWSNNLPSDTIKPGWDLVIMPVNGVIHTVTQNDTLPDIAKEYNVDMNTIIAYNNLSSDDDINPGDVLIIPGGTVTPPPKPKPSIAHTVKTNRGNIIVYEPIPDDITNYGGAEHSFPWGECTWYVAQRRNVPWGGNARDWLANAAAVGAKEGHNPMVGSIAVFVGSGYSRYGHVAIVSAVSDNSFEVSEMNYEGRGVLDSRWVSDDGAGLRGFIY